jgi:hypothetical protein
MYNLKMKKDVLDFVNHLNNTPYLILQDGYVHFCGSVILDRTSWSHLPVKIGIVDGMLSFENGLLDSLLNFPECINSQVWIRGNRKKFTEEEVRKVCKVERGVYV